jgi:DNA mismatch repair protein MSH3
MPKAKAKNPSNSRSQGTISAYFTQSSPAKSQSDQTKKRPFPIIDLTEGDEHQSPVLKRQRSSQTPPAESHSIAGANAEAVLSCTKSRATQQWSFNPASPTQASQPNKVANDLDDAARRERHEAFKRKLLGENSSFFQRRSDAQGEAMDVDREVSVDLRDEVSPGRERTEEPTDGSGDESDQAFKDLTEMFSLNKGRRKSAAKAKRKTKSSSSTAVGGASTSKKRAEEEVGPSGQAYTPLEKQVGCSTSHCSAYRTLIGFSFYRFSNLRRRIQEHCS